MNRCAPTIVAPRPARGRCALSGSARRKKRRGFTLVEAVISMLLITVASSAVLTSVNQSLQRVDYSIRNQIALGLAQQLLDEQSGKMYMVPGASPTDPYLGPSAQESALPGHQYNDLDDYNGLSLSPPTDRWGITMGTDDGDGSARDPAFQLGTNYLSRYTQKVTVSYVQPSAPSTPITNGTTTYYRLSQVQIIYNDRQTGNQTLASLTRVFTYVPTN